MYPHEDRSSNRKSLPKKPSRQTTVSNQAKSHDFSPQDGVSTVIG